MTLAEGIIRFAYELKPPAVAVIEDGQFRELAAWRELLRRLELLGQHPDRYQGLGYGNLSVRDPDRPDEFVITASQTSGEATLETEHMVRITRCSLERFWIDAEGVLPPSSEAMTHAMIYHCDARIQWVFHCHSAALWQAADALALPCTEESVQYGSPDMVNAVAELFERHHSRPLLFASLGHEDGIFSCGASARDAGGLLVTYLAKALALEPDS
jgi:ribulose-5-phosphate 4-epimerase/fuculose-1-phosphate aldolase